MSAIDTQAKPTRAQRKKMTRVIEGLRKSYMNISFACRYSNIDRQTYYNWIDKFDSFKKEVADAEEELLDNVETLLHKKIINGDTVSMIFFLKTKGKRRGYIEGGTLDLTSSDGSLSPAPALDASKLSDGALKEILAAKDAKR